jgi:two-component system copper resistance phosphate regulon response regulator CusR
MTKLLVIDDEPRIVDFLARALAAHGFGVDRAHGGAEGLARTRAEPYDLVVLDLRMPHVDGLAVLEGTLAARPAQRVIVLSALADVETKVRALELGACDYLTKPFATAELLARIGAQLRRAAQAPGQAEPRLERRAGIELDLDRRTADAGQGPVGLSAREFELLRHLMVRQGDVCTREELLKEVWGCEFDPGTNVVDVGIRRLRCKLGTDVVATIRNVGYALEAA